MSTGERCPWEGRAGTCGVLGRSSNPLRHRYENRFPVVECKHYLQDQGISVGCHFNQSEIIQFQTFRVLINASLDGRTLNIPSEPMQLQDLGKQQWRAPTLLLCGAAVGQEGVCSSPGLPHHVPAGGGATRAWGQHSLGVTCKQ